MIKLPSAAWRFLLVFALVEASVAAAFLLLAGGRETPESAVTAVSLMPMALVLIVAGGGVFLASLAHLLGPAGEFNRAIGRRAMGNPELPASLRRAPQPWRELAETLEATDAETSRREQELRAGIEQMNVVLASMIEGVVAIDTGGRIQLANDAACRMLSRKLSELAGQRLFDTVRYPVLRNAIEEAQLTRASRTIELETLALGGPRRLLLASVTALADRSTGGLVIVLHDVTDLRRMESMRHDFVANVSHELKTPLSAIKAFAETLRLGALHDETANMDFVQQIESQAELLEQQVQKLLELSQAQSGRAVMEFRPVDLNQACRTVVEQFRAEADSRSVKLTCTTREPVTVMGDADAIHTILRNLISNALRYTPGGGKVEVLARRETAQPLIEVVDSGIGIAPDHQSRVFERFYRVDRARSRDMGGTGLGLAIVKHLAQSLGGGVELESRIGRGSTFRVRLRDSPES